jgi:hypothetical protein
LGVEPNAAEQYSQSLRSASTRRHTSNAQTIEEATIAGGCLMAPIGQDFWDSRDRMISRWRSMPTDEFNRTFKNSSGEQVDLTTIGLMYPRSMLSQAAYESAPEYEKPGDILTWQEKLLLLEDV